MIIDCDSHIMPRDAFEHVDPTMAPRMPHPKFDSEGRFIEIDFPGNPAYIPGTTPLPLEHVSSGLKYKGNSDIEARLADYARIGVDAHFALPQLSGWWSYLIDQELGCSIARSWNVSLVNLMLRYPGKVLGVALVPLQDVTGAINEVEWAVRQGFPAILLDYVYPVVEHPYGTTLASHPEVWPFFRRVEELKVPIFLHAVQHGHRILNVPRFQEHGLDLCAPGDAELNLISLITSGLLDDFPGLQFIHAETGTAYIKSLAQRLDARFQHIPIRYDEEGFTAPSRRKESFKEFQAVPPTVLREKNKLLPSHYFRNNFHWTIETEEPELVEAVEFLGADRFLFATDYPHDDAGGRMKFKDVELLHKISGITEAGKEAIRSGNARRLFKIT
jgi:predicted TIM-barrel fold metal-dependent hydrolase